MSFAFHPEAEIEFNGAIDYYERIELGLGYDFAIERDIRRSLVKRFPYGILYSEEESGIYIIAVMHLHRFPDYWKHRK